MNINAAFQWECQPRAEQFIQTHLDHAIKTNSVIAKLSEDLLKQTSSRLFDWLDHLIVENSQEIQEELRQSGFIRQQLHEYEQVYFHPGAQLPRVVLQTHEKDPIGIAVIVDVIADFIQAHGGSDRWIEGSVYSGYRRCSIHTQAEVAMWVVERRGTLTLQPTQEDADRTQAYLEGFELWKKRPRSNDNEELSMQMALTLAEELVRKVGKDRAAWTVLAAERDYWQAKNTAGQIQKARQDRLGMGWANHDHHTFRSSRKFFAQLVKLFEILGFHCRERFYAGQEAGWGAQVMESTNGRFVLFLDVDLSPNEITGDFAHEPLPEINQLGTIGLWCALHGDSILKAGMHHLESQFMFDELTEDLAKVGIKMMNPFSSFSYLRQAFTAGEVWHVDPKRVELLLKKGLMTKEQAENFLKNGALGSHLENLQRREGYKGFNQKNVSLIIKETDPRLAKVETGAA